MCKIANTTEVNLLYIWQEFRRHWFTKYARLVPIIFFFESDGNLVDVFLNFF